MYDRLGNCIYEDESQAGRYCLLAAALWTIAAISTLLP